MEALEEKDTLFLSVAEHLPLGTLTVRHTLPCTDGFRVGTGGRAG